MTIKVGLIGYGFSGQCFHAPFLRLVPDFDFCAIATSNAQKVKEDGLRVKTYATAADLYADSSIDLVVIAATHAVHFELAEAALNAKKHVVIDKPFTVTFAEAEKLVALAKQVDRVITVYQNRRYDGDFVTLKAQLATGRIGKVSHFEIHFDRYRPVVKPSWQQVGGLGVGLWYDLVPHLLDHAFQLFGAPQSMHTERAAFRPTSLYEDWYHATLSYADKKVVLHSTSLAAYDPPRFLAHGDKGSLHKFGLDVQEDQLKAKMTPDHPDFGLDPNPVIETLMEEAGPVVTEYACARGQYLHYYQGVADALLGRAEIPVTTDQALEVMYWLDYGYRSSHL